MLPQRGVVDPQMQNVMLSECDSRIYVCHARSPLHCARWMPSGNTEQGWYAGRDEAEMERHFAFQRQARSRTHHLREVSFQFINSRVARFAR